MKYILCIIMIIIVSLIPYTVSKQESNNKPLPKKLVRITHYTPSGKLTSTGDTVKPRRTVAVSPKCKHLLGKKIYIEDYGIRHINDTTASWLDDKHGMCTIDIAVSNKHKAVKLGTSKKHIVILED